MNLDNLSAADLSPVDKKGSGAFVARIKKFISFTITFLICFTTWIILSGRFDLFHLGLGVIACTIVARLSGTIAVS